MIACGCLTNECGVAAIEVGPNRRGGRSGLRNNQRWQRAPILPSCHLLDLSGFEAVKLSSSVI